MNPSSASRSAGVAPRVKSKKSSVTVSTPGQPRRSTQPASRKAYLVSSWTNWVRTSRAIDGRPVTANVPAYAAPPTPYRNAGECDRLRKLRSE